MLRFGDDMRRLANAEPGLQNVVCGSLTIIHILHDGNAEGVSASSFGDRNNSRDKPSNLGNAAVLGVLAISYS
jgi:hypothetical protein